MRMILFLSAALVVALAGVHEQSGPTSTAGAPRSTQQPTESERTALRPLEPFDSHTHVAEGDPSFYAMLERWDMHIVDILLVDDHDSYRKAMEPQLEDALRVVHDSHGHASLCTSFDPFRFGQGDFSASVIRDLDRDFAAGAVAVKIWKNIGMELKDRNGRYVLPDDPVFSPIYQEIARHGRALIAHIAEPDEAFEPPNPNGLDYSYYKENPVWYMYAKPEAPRKPQLLEARDHVLAQNPRLRVVGAHLGSMEDDLDAVARDLDRYPNFAVDTAARVVHLVVMPNERVRAFILKYQDRILYGTDLGFHKGQSPQEVVQEWEQQYADDWRYFATQDQFEYSGHKVQGLGLPQTVLRKLYHQNTVDWLIRPSGPSPQRTNTK